MDTQYQKLRTLRRLLLWVFAAWALVIVTPLFMILRELVGPAREVFNVGMLIVPFALITAVVVVSALAKPRKTIGTKQSAVH